LPEKYDGNSSPDVLEDWILLVLRYFRLYGLIRKSNDSIMVNMIGMFLSDTALEWFRSMVERDCKPWSPPKVFYGLRDQFIHELELHKAANRFDALSQGKMDSEQLYQELVKLAQRMVESPSSYDLKQRYYEALRLSI
jgi:hypothetical protein